MLRDKWEASSVFRPDWAAYDHIFTLGNYTVYFTSSTEEPDAVLQMQAELAHYRRLDLTGCINYPRTEER